MKSRKFLWTKRVLNLLLFTLPISLFAKGGNNSAASEMIKFVYHNLLFIMGAVVIIFVLATILSHFFTLMNAEKKRLYKEMNIALPAKPVKAPLWDRIYAWGTNMIPVEKEADVMLNHDYDGIHELDNSLPPWWLAMFYITIFAGVAYFAYYHIYDYGMSSSEAYALEMKYANEARERFMEKQANMINESNVTALVDEKLIAAGAGIYKSNCIACHGALGEGGVGPNLTDNYWLHGTGDIKSIFKVIKYGVPQKGMIAWKDQLRPADIHQVASFILTLKGTQPPNAKEAQGERVEESIGLENNTENESLGSK